MATTTWTYEGYWNMVIGDDRSPEGVIEEFGLNPDDRVGLDEWLGIAEAESALAGGLGRNLPEEWAAFHIHALDELEKVGESR